jgi:serine/threonine protein kinase
VRERIGSYRIERVLAEGGMGLVYKGRHEKLGRDAVIKTLLPKHAGDAALRARLLREAQAQARLTHDHIVRVYDLIEDHDELFIAMEYVDGETVEGFLDRQPGSRLRLDEALLLFGQALSALAYVHDEKIVHRDVKPSNFLISGGVVKLTDFGIALLTESPRLTASAQRFGTPQYMSPEQLEGKSCDPRSDIYSAALVFYRMLAGRAPFEPMDYFAHIQARLAGPVSLRVLAPEVPAGVCDAVAIALRYDPEERFRTIAEFRDALRDGDAGFFVSALEPVEDDVRPNPDDVPTEPMAVAPATVPEPEPGRSTAVVATIIASAFVAAILIIVYRPSRPTLFVSATVQRPAVPSTMTASPAPKSEVPKLDVAAAVPPPVVPPWSVPPKGNPFPVAVTKSEPAEDAEAKRRRELESLRDAIRLGLARAEQELTELHFDAAVGDLDRIAEMAQRDPDNFRDERAQIAQMRASVVEKRVAAETAKVDAAQWATKLAEIEEDLHAEHWVEAERFATRIVKDSRAPEAIAARARTLLERAKEGHMNAFKDTQVGPTNNTIRKPSSPPRNEV